MKIISDFEKDVRTRKPQPGSYEWWYFDARSVDGYSIVIIFYEGNPFSKRYIKGIKNKKNNLAEGYPAISISLYKDGKPLFYAFEEMAPDRCNFSEIKPAGNIGSNKFVGEKNETRTIYSVKLDQKMINGDEIKGELTFTSHSSEIRLADNSTELPSNHTWNLIQPDSDVSGDISIEGYRNEKISFKGKGYHDHNFGCEHMKHSFGEWYWGRYHFEDSTLVYYLMYKNGIWEKKAWLFGEDGSVKKIEEKIELSAYQLSMFGLSSARKIEFEQGNFKAILQLDHLMDNGPFYQRFEGRLLADYKGKPFQTRGISEFFKPARIYNRLFWPLVDMRIKYPGEKHWVQKSPVLYRWTW